MKRVLAGLAAGAMWLCAAMPAAAQSTYNDLTDDQLSELYCVADYLDLFTGTAKVVDAYTGGDPNTEGFAQVDADVQEASGICMEEYAWDEEEAGPLTMIGLYSLIGDEMELRLGQAGVDEEGLDAIYGAADLISDADLNAFIDGVWLDDAALTQRVTDALAKKGIGGDGVVKNAMFLMEAYIIVAVTIDSWLSMQSVSSSQ